MPRLPTGGVYVLVDRKTGQVMRVGQTINLTRREAEHRRDERTQPYEFVPRFYTDSYPTRRGLEQMLHDQYAPPLDRQNPINPRSPRRKKYLAAARRFLQG